MKREQLSKVIENIDEELIAEAYQFNPSKCSESPERIVDPAKSLAETVTIHLKQPNPPVLAR